MKKPLPELLAPAGSYEALTAAVEAGADAVYLGALSFSARANATNFDEESAARAIAYCHAFGVKVYAAMNTLLFDREAEDFLKTAAAFYRMGADALIVADLGGMRLLRRHVPKMPIHASTQASIHSVDGVRAMAALGVERVVLARELPLADIRKVTTHGGLETEIFVHGALCVSHSGQCLLSSMIGGRSGNRGACAQPCRLPYGKGYPLSLRDLSLADHIPELINSGVSSLKLEGRMKSPAYVYGVTQIYRRLLDEGRSADREENRRLRELFSRDGFTSAYFRGHPEEPMTGRRSEADKEAGRALPPPPPPKRRASLTAEAVILAGEPSRLTLTRADGKRATAFSTPPEAARSAPLTAESVCERLGKTGGTVYTLAARDISLSLGEGLNLSPATLNSLRSEAIALLDRPEGDRANFSLPEGCGHISPNAKRSVQEPPCTALFFDPALLLRMDAALLSRFSVIFVPLWRFAEGKGQAQGVYLPPVCFDHEREAVLKMLKDAKEAGATHALCGNLGLVAAARALGYRIVGDFRLGATNRETVATLYDCGVDYPLLSPELSLARLRDIGEGGCIVSGRLPLMLLERCFTRENFGCDRCGRAALTDRRGARFPLLREYPHRNLLLNSLPTHLGEQAEALRGMGIGAHFLFTVETPEEAETEILAYFSGRKPPFPVRGLPK